MNISTSTHQLGLPPELAGVDLNLLTPSVRAAPALISKETWRKFIQYETPQKPPLLTEKVAKSFSKDSAARYRAIRKRWHAKLPPLTLPALTQIRDTIVRMSLMGLDLHPGVRPGALINGQPTLGKSTILTEIGRNYETQLRKRMGSSITDDHDEEFIPVVYTTLTSNETGKGLSARLLDFYGYPFRSSLSESTLAGLLSKQAASAGTSLILVDDIHFLDPRFKNGQAVNTHLKALASTISATFVYAGVDVDKTGLLFEGRPESKAQAAQTQRRFKRMDLMPFTKEDPVLVEVLEALEKQLLLLNAREGDLQNLVGYIHDRTDGYMGPITALIREGAALAIEEGQERISRAILQRVTLDHASQRRFQALNA